MSKLIRDIKNRQDAPEQGKQYLLVGDGSTPSIARGDTWKDSEVEPIDDVERALEKHRQPQPLEPMYQTFEGFIYVMMQYLEGNKSWACKRATYLGFNASHLLQMFSFYREMYSDTRYLANASRDDIYRAIALMGAEIEQVSHARYSLTRDQCPHCLADAVNIPPQELCSECDAAGITWSDFLEFQTKL